MNIDEIRTELLVTFVMSFFTTYYILFFIFLFEKMSGRDKRDRGFLTENISLIQYVQIPFLD